MIFVITPTLVDFKRTCIANDIECKFNFNQMPISKNIRWVSSEKSLWGMPIKKDDRIVWGKEAARFKPEVYQAIQNEIELRTKDHV